MVKLHLATHESLIETQLDELKIEARSLDDEASDTSQEESYRTTPSGMQEFERAPSERHGFLFKHNLNPPAPDIRNLHPLPSQVPFLLDAYSENVNFIAQVVHMPTINKMARDMRVNGMMSLTPANEALLFSMYYAAVASMEDDDVSAPKRWVFTS